MRKNKFLIYIVMFFAFFLIGTMKVNAAVRYQVCHYTLSKKDANAGLSSDESVYVVYIDGKFRAAAANNADKTTGTLVEVSENKLNRILKFSTEPGNTCPNVTFLGYRYYGGGVSQFSSPKTPTKQETIFSKDLSDKTCEYKSERSQGTLQSNLNGDNVSIDIAYESTFKDNSESIFSGSYINLKQTYSNGHVIPDMLWSIDDKNHSEMATYIDFIKNTKGGCPLYVSGKEGQFSNNIDNALNPNYDIFRYSTCEYKNNSTYNDIISWQKKNYSASSKKTTAKLDKKFGEELGTQKNKWVDLYNGMNESQQVNCDTTAITDKFEKMCEQCNKEKNCANEETRKAAQQFAELNGKLGGLDISIDTDKTYTCEQLFGDPDNPDSFISIVKRILLWIRIAAPILLIVLGIVDFSKVTLSQDPDALKKATSAFSKRCIAAVIVFFIPLFMSIIMGWINDYIMSTDANCISTISYIISNVRR